MGRMISAPLRQPPRPGPAVSPVRWLVSWWEVILFGSALLVLALSPSSYRSPRMRAALARHTWLDTAPILLGFSMLVALLSVVLTRIVVVTARSYGLSQYALEMVIRVLVLELIPLTAALFVALRCTIPNGAALAEMRRSGRFAAMRRAGDDPLVLEVLPRILAGAFSAITLAALSCFVAAVLAYLAVYQLTPAGLPAYTRMFGHVFNPSVSLIFAIKTVFFALSVAVIPMASGAYEDFAAPSSRESAALQGLVRMFAVLLMLEAVSLVGNYY
jgi:phospholipid/cholesterol/gamma-HCH transport system permease protein